MVFPMEVNGSICEVRSDAAGGGRLIPTTTSGSVTPAYHETDALRPTLAGRMEVSELAEERLRYAEIAPEGIGAMRALEHYLNATSGLGASLLGLIRLRASLINGCEFCIALHTRELKLQNEPEGRVAALVDWRTSDAYTQRERSALAWTEAVTSIAVDHAPDALFGELREHFDDKEIVDLTIAIATINAWNRLAISFRAQWKNKAPEEIAAKAGATGDDSAREDGNIDDRQSVLQDDGGKVSVD